MTLAGSAQTLYQRTEKCAGSAGRFNSNELREIPPNRIPDQIKDQLNYPFARKYLAVLAVDVGDQVREDFGNERKLA